MPGLPLKQDEIECWGGVAKRLKEITRQAAAAFPGWAFVLDVADKSWKHGVGSPEPWVNGADGPMPGGAADDGIPWHPNRRGMKAIGEELKKWVFDHKDMFGL